MFVVTFFFFLFFPLVCLNFLRYSDTILNDILEIEASMPDTVRAPSGDAQLINWSKRMQIFSQLQAIQSFQATAYNLQPVLQIQSLLDTRVMDYLDEPALAKLASENNKQP